MEESIAPRSRTMRPNVRHRLAYLMLLALCIAVIGGCRRHDDAALTGGATKPSQAVKLLTQHLRKNDLNAFARDAVPPALYARLKTAWRDGRTRWPLDELPFDERLPNLLATLAAPTSETTLQQSFDRQFAHADAELKTTAVSLGVFGAQYVQNDPAFSAVERDHYAQLMTAAAQWASAAPLSDPQRAHKAIGLLSTAARKTNLTQPADFARNGMQESLRRLSAFQTAFKQTAALYGLSLDASLDGMEVGLQTQTGDRARVRMRYRLGQHAIDTFIDVERIQGRWYVSDFLRHAEVAVGAAPIDPSPQP